MTKAIAFATKNPRVKDLRILQESGANEASAHVWEFTDGSLLKVQPTGGLDGGGYLLAPLPESNCSAVS